MRTVAITILSILMVVALSIPVRASDYVAMTPPLPPYSINKGLHVQGIAVDTLVMIMSLSGSPMVADDVKLMLWSHAFKLATIGPKRILLNMPKTEQTAELFKWVGPIHASRYVVIGRNDAPTVNSLEELSKHRIATIRDSLPEKTLLQAGVPKHSLKPSLTHVIPLKKLKQRMVDYFVHTHFSATYMLEKMGMRLNKYKVHHAFMEVDLYYAFSKDTPDTFIEKLNTTLAKLKEPGKDGRSRFDRIVAKYLPHGTIE